MALQEAVKQANSAIGGMYEGYVSYSVVAQSLVRPHIRHMCVLLPRVMPNVRHVHLGLNVWINLKGRITCIWSFGCDFAFAITMGCAALKLSFGIIIIL